MSDHILKCHICGKLYITYMFYVGDQSACPKCRQQAKQNTWTSDEQVSIRRLSCNG